MANEWQPIETAPRDGSRILCWRPGWQPVFLMWKRNDRITRSLAELKAKDRRSNYEYEWMVSHVDTYFGDCNEADDYDLAKIGEGPTHWLPLSPPSSSPAAQE